MVLLVLLAVLLLILELSAVVEAVFVVSLEGTLILVVDLSALLLDIVITPSLFLVTADVLVVASRSCWCWWWSVSSITRVQELSDDSLWCLFWGERERGWGAMAMMLGDVVVGMLIKIENACYDR